MATASPFPRKKRISFERLHKSVRIAEQDTFISCSEGARLTGYSAQAVWDWAHRDKRYELSEDGKILRASFLKVHPNVAENELKKAMTQFVAAVAPDRKVTVSKVISAVFESLVRNDRDAAEVRALVLDDPQIYGTPRTDKKPRPKAE